MTRSGRSAALRALFPIALMLFSAACEKPKVVQIPVGAEFTEAIFWRSSKEQSPAVLLIPRAGGSKEGWLPLARKFQKAGFGILALDLRGQGSAGPHSILEDVRAAFSYLRMRPSVDAARIGLVGIAAGADAALLFAAEEPLVQFTALASPGLAFESMELSEVVHEYGFRPLFVGAAGPGAGPSEAAGRLSETIRGDTVVKDYAASPEAEEFLSEKGPFGRDVLAFLKARL